MRKRKAKSSKKKLNPVGLHPGAYIEQVSESADYMIRALKYSPKEVAVIEEELPVPSQRDVLWLDICGSPSAELLTQISQKYGIHSLTLEDILNLSHRPKYEEFDDYLFFIVKTVSLGEESLELVSSQKSLIVGKGFVLSFQDQKEHDFFFPIRQRIQKGRGRIRQKMADYLAYSLLDLVVDHYFHALRTIDEKIESIEIENPRKDYSLELELGYGLRKKLSLLRKRVGPVREFLSTLLRQPPDMIDPVNNIYFRDLSDHISHISDSIESHRENLTASIENILSLNSYNMNGVMKLLTIISAIFLPLNLVVGFYGMNINTLPLASRTDAVLIVSLTMVIVALILTYIFKRRKLL